MNELTCPCFMKTDLELAVDKLSFLEENYSCMNSPEYLKTLPKHELLCCLCLIDVVILSIKQKRYTCTITELIRLYECRENIILVLFVKYKFHPRL